MGLKEALAAAAALAPAAVMAQPTPMPTRTPGAPPNCIYDSQAGATYDLGQMYNPYGYTLFDTNNKTAPGAPVFSYRFSLCTNIDPTQVGLPQCAVTYGVGNVSMTGPAGAFKYCTANCDQLGPWAQCQRVGGDAFNSVSLRVFPWNPAHGVSVTYTAGDACATSFGQTWGMGMQLDMQCADRAGLISRGVDIIPSGDNCFTNAVFASDAACPLECPVVTQAPGIVHRLCGGRGICDYDRSKSAARCFCNQGWSGVDCMSQGDKGLPAAPSFAGPIAGGFVGGVLGGAALLLGVLFARAKMTGNDLVDAISFPGSLGGGGGGYPGSSGAAPSIAASGFGSDGGAGASMDDAYGKLAALGGGDGLGGGAAFAGSSASTGYVAPDLSAPAPGGGGDGPLLA